MKNRHWLELTEYVSIAGVATGAVASFLAKQAIYLSTPLSIALLIGFANRRRVEQLQEEQIEKSIAALKQKLSKQIKVLDQHIKTLPTPEMVGDVRNSMLRHSRDELKQLTIKINTINETIDQYATLLDEQNLGGVKDEVQQLQGFYREMYGSLKRMQQTVERVDAKSDNQDIRTQMTQLRTEAEQLQMGLQSLTDQTQPTLSYLQEQVNHLNRQNTSILQQVDTNTLKRELDILMDAVAELAPKRELTSVMSDIRALQENQEAQGQSGETLRKQLQKVMQRLQAIPDVPQFRAQIEETLSWQLRDINQQLRTLQNTKQFQVKVKEILSGELDTINRQLQQRSEGPSYRLIFDLTHGGDLTAKNGQQEEVESSSPKRLGSQQLLEEALATAKQRLILIWPWSSTLLMDKALMKKLEGFVRQGRQLEVGWCHITASEDQRFLSVINRRWNLESVGQRSLQLTLKYLLALKRRYPKQVKFRVMGTVENFLVADRTFAALGIEDRLTTITPLKDVSLKLWTSDEAVIQQLIQTFENTALDPEDMESHWNRAVTRYELGDRAGAMADIEHILAVMPNSAIAYNMRGIIHFDEKDPSTALDDFEQALALDPTKGSVYCNRGFLLSERGDQYRAIADFSLAIQYTLAHENPTSLGIAYFYRGLACQKLADFEGAMSDYTNALAYIVDSPVIRYHRGITYQAIAQHAAAIEDLEQATVLFQQQNSTTNAQRSARHLEQSRVASQSQSQAIAIDTPTSDTSSTEVSAEQIAMPTKTALDATELDAVVFVATEQKPDTSTEANERLTPDSRTNEADEIAIPEVTMPLSAAKIRMATETIASQNPQPLMEQQEPIVDQPPMSESASSETATPSRADYSVATPNFLFPGENRSRPSMIQDMDEFIDDLSDNLPSETDNRTTDSLQLTATENPSALNSKPADRQSWDIFANLADSETAEKSRSDNEIMESEPDFAATDLFASHATEADGSSASAVAAMEFMAVDVATTSESSPIPDTTNAEETNIGELASSESLLPIDVSTSETPPHLPAQQSPTQPGPRRRRKTDLDRLVTTTLTDFFDEVDLANLSAQTFREFAAGIQSPATTPLPISEASNPDPTDPLPTNPDSDGNNAGLSLFDDRLLDDCATSNNLIRGDRRSATNGTPINRHVQVIEYSDLFPEVEKDTGEKQVVPDSSGFSQSSLHPSQSAKDDPEMEVLVTSTLTNFFDTLSGGDFDLAAFERMTQDQHTSPSPLLQKSQEHEQAESDPSTTAPSTDDTRQLVSRSDFSDNPSGAPEAGTETLDNFMESLQNSFDLAHQTSDDYSFPMADVELSDESQYIKPPIKAVNQSSPQMDFSMDETSTQPSSSFSTQPSLGEPPQSSPSLMSNSHRLASHPAEIPMISELPTPDGMELGTATMTNLMVAMQGEDLSTQTLRDFFSILNEENIATENVVTGEIPSPKSENALGSATQLEITSSSEVAKNPDHLDRNSDSNGTESDPSGAKVSESLLDFSDCF